MNSPSRHWRLGEFPPKAAEGVTTLVVPSPRLTCRLGSCAPVGRVQDRRSWQRRPVRGRAPLALAHPLPCSYQAKGDSPRHGRGKILLYISFQRGSWRSPFETPTGRKVRGGNTFLVIGAFGGYSLRHAAGVTPPSMREAGSHLPVRVLRPGGARPGPTVVATETGSRQSATGARSPPPTTLLGKESWLTIVGGGFLFSK